MTIKDEQSETPTLCKMGCGFFGSPKTRNLCSVCFKLVLKEEAEIPVVSEDDRRSPPKSLPGVDTKKRNRCGFCNKRAGLIKFGCRCGQTFCGLHRMPEVHACGFDFKAVGRAVLEKENPLCVADKLKTRI